MAKSTRSAATLYIFIAMNYVWLSVGWVVYFALHSMLAADSTKELAKRLMRSSFKIYRLLYALFSTAGLAALLFLGANIPATYFFERTELLRYISLMFTTFGVMTIRLAFKQFEFKSFMGFSAEATAFKREGILKHVRHPILSGIVLITIGYFIFIPNLPSMVSCLCILVYLPIGMWLEEKKLVAAFGEEYLRYKREVPAIFPKLHL